MPCFCRLLTLKEKFKEANGGVPFDPPAEKKPKKEKKEEPPKQPEGEEKTGPSKKVRLCGIVVVGNMEQHEREVGSSPA